MTDPPPHRRLRWTAADPLGVDLLLYASSALFAAATAGYSTLAPHRAWGTTAALGYAVAALAVLTQLIARRGAPASRWAGRSGRYSILAWAAATTVVVPLVQQAAQRAAGRPDRAQEEVTVIERAGARLVEHGTPYLDRAALAALPSDERLLGYLPYQPGMALFGLPRALAGVAWWTDARVWFALVTAAALVAAVRAVRPGPGAAGRVLPAVQAATVLPVCALTLATGGDDLPVLAFCLLSLALLAVQRYGSAGIAIGAASALKLLAWPVLAVLLVHVITRGRRPAGRFATAALGLPLAAALPAALLDAPALVENVVRFPVGLGLVDSPARSPLPGHLIATVVPAGRPIAVALLVAAGVLIAVRLVRRPPRTAAAAALVAGYGLLAAILLMPATRFGYLLYPVALLAWCPALAQPPPALTGAEPAAGRARLQPVPSHHADDLS